MASLLCTIAIISTIWFLGKSRWRFSRDTWKCLKSVLELFTWKLIQRGELEVNSFQAICTRSDISTCFPSHWPDWVSRRLSTSCPGLFHGNASALFQKKLNKTRNKCIVQSGWEWEWNICWSWKPRVSQSTASKADWASIFWQVWSRITQGDGEGGRRSYFHSFSSPSICFFSISTILSFFSFSYLSWICRCDIWEKLIHPWCKMIAAESHQIIQQIVKYNILNKNKISAWSCFCSSDCSKWCEIQIYQLLLKASRLNVLMNYPSDGNECIVVVFRQWNAASETKMLQTRPNVSS